MTISRRAADGSFVPRAAAEVPDIPRRLVQHSAGHTQLGIGELFEVLLLIVQNGRR